MNYIKWLESIGLNLESVKLSKNEVQKLAFPLGNPGTEKMKVIKRIVVHHSATETGNAACFRVLHRAVNGWNDVGYHYVIGNGTLTGSGEVEDGRKLPFVGAHAKGANEDSIGICLVGNFNRQKPSDKQLSSLVSLILKLKKLYSLVNADITLHKLVKGSSTECPGKNFSLEKLLLLLNNNELQ